jgi:hypothetical protein
VRHEQLRPGWRDTREQLAAALAIGLAITTGRREHDGVRTTVPERFGERGADRPLRIRRGEQIRAAARAATDDLTAPVDRERARLGGAGVDPDDDPGSHAATAASRSGTPKERMTVYGRWSAPPETARAAPVARGRVLGRPRSR